MADALTNYADDPRAVEAIAHIKKLGKQLKRPPSVADFQEYRDKQAPTLVSLTTIYRLFGKWHRLLAAADLGHSDRHTSRTPDDRLVAALKQAADELSVDVLSSHMYDTYRAEKAPELPSSSVIRKWLGPWADAVEKAGLQTSNRTLPRRPSKKDVLVAICNAKREVDGMLDMKAYSQWYSALSEERQETTPDVLSILHHYPTWDAALREADVEQSDALHPTALWAADEARKIYTDMQRVAESLYHGALDEEIYNELCHQSRKPLPTWDVLVYLLKL